MLTTRRRFVIVGMPRSGTTVVHRALAGHPNVMMMMDEVKVDPFFTEGIAHFTVSGKNEFQRNHGYGLLIDAMTLIPGDRRGADVMGYGGTDEHPKSETLANGFKVVVLTPQEAHSLVTTVRSRPSLRDLHIIRVRRRDIVALTASLERAKMTARWHSFFEKDRAHDKSGKPDSIFIEESHFVRRLEEAAAIEAILDRLNPTHKVTEVDYDTDIVAKGKDAFGPIFSMLGLPLLDPCWLASAKISPPPHDFVANADRLYEIQLAFLGRP